MKGSPKIPKRARDAGGSKVLTSICLFRVQRFYDEVLDLLSYQSVYCPVSYTGVESVLTPKLTFRGKNKKLNIILDF